MAGQNGQDGSDLLHGGFRVDSAISKRDSLTAQGELYKGSEGEIISIVALTPPFDQTVAARTTMDGGNILGRWNHIFSPQSDTSLQIYFDRAERNRVIEEEEVDTFDIDFQHHVGWGQRQDFVWGAGYRYYSYATTGSVNASFSPAAQNRQLFTSFVQDEITLEPKRLYLMIGAKLEHNDFTGFVFQPSAGIDWNITKNHMLWAGYSRARRTPSPADRTVSYTDAALPGPGGIPVLLTVQGDPNTVNENLDAIEAGYRAQLRANISLDLSTFYNRYGDLVTFEPGTPYVDPDPPPPHLNVPLYFANEMYGESHGVELAVNWKIKDRWTLSPGYAFERIHLHLGSESHDTTSVSAGEGNSPHVQAQLRSSLILTRRFEWNTSAYFVGRLLAEQVPSYTRLDSGITWRANKHLAVSLIGQNLLKDHHLEANSEDQTEISSLIKRSAYAKFTWQF
jgi:iron complex outermembrane receptor protein